MIAGPAASITQPPQLLVDQAWKLRSSAEGPVLPSSHVLGSVLLHGLFLAGLMTASLDRPQNEQVILPYELAIEIAAAPAAASDKATDLLPAVTQIRPSARSALPDLSPPEPPSSDSTPAETWDDAAFPAPPAGKSFSRPAKPRPIKQADQADRPDFPARSIEMAPTASEAPSPLNHPQLMAAPPEPAASGEASSQRPAAGSEATHIPVAAAQTEIPVVQQARFRRQPRPPQYPARARALDQQGTCIVRALIDQSGSSREVLLWRSSGFELLDQAALAAVRGWAFDAARRNDEPVLAWVEIPVRFEIR